MSKQSDNSEREARGAEALDTYIAGNPIRKHELSPTEWLVDLLTDLRHHAKASGIIFADAVRVSQYHFDSESDSE